MDAAASPLSPRRPTCCAPDRGPLHGFCLVLGPKPLLHVQAHVREVKAAGAVGLLSPPHRGTQATDAAQVHCPLHSGF